jgi:maltooligosyltrehalose trehalohydrolase
MRIGATYLGDNRCEFRVWSPLLKSVSVTVLSPKSLRLKLERDEHGYWSAVTDAIQPGATYKFKLDRKGEFPDPASRFQPNGVHGFSEVVDQQFDWTDGEWRGIPLDQMIMYEIHVGTFTPEGTFDVIIPRLDELVDVGINTIELMPVAQFPGPRTWGYDGAFPFAVQNSYGGPAGLKRLVNACHGRGLAVILDVVYNHLGPEGNYLMQFGPYFTDKYKTPWGMAVNYDGPFSDDVRNYFIENALYWLGDFHIDALRLDAVHAIYDFSAKPFLQELAERVEDFSRVTGRKRYLIAESDLNDTRVIAPPSWGGFGIDAQWLDDFHHAVRTLLTGDRTGYYEDFGSTDDLKKVLTEGYAYSWRYSKFRNRHHGNSSNCRPADQFIVFTQNHDQIGNHMLGKRLSKLVSFESIKLAAGILLLSPYIPLIFMGEEYGETHPFLYFISHSDRDLVRAVRKGRMGEFRSFKRKGQPPDPQSLETFERSKLDWKQRTRVRNKVLLQLYQQLIDHRKQIPALSCLNKDSIEVAEPIARVITLRRWFYESEIYCAFNFNQGKNSNVIITPEGQWKRIIDSADKMWAGPGNVAPERIDGSRELTFQPQSFLLYERELPTLST